MALVLFLLGFVATLRAAFANIPLRDLDVEDTQSLLKNWELHDVFGRSFMDHKIGGEALEVLSQADVDAMIKDNGGLRIHGKVLMDRIARLQQAGGVSTEQIRGRRALKADNFADYDGIRIKSDNSIITMGKKEDVKIVRTGKGKVKVLASLDVDGVINAKGLKVDGKDVSDLVGTGSGGGGSDIGGYGRVGSYVINTASKGSWALPAGVNAIKVYLTGGGGGGGGHRASCNNNGMAGGGGGGGTAIKWITGLPKGAKLVYSIGNGGTGGLRAHGGNGAESRAVVNGITLKAGGGIGGQRVDAIGHDAHGGSASGGDINVWGGGGGGGSDTSPVETSGVGGGTYWGGGPTGAYAENGHNGRTPGAGGSGADDCNRRGGKGKEGMVYIETWASAKVSKGAKTNRYGYMGMIKFESSATYTLPKGVTAVEAYVTGGGGGGGGHRQKGGNNGYAGGGGGGGTAIRFISGLKTGAKVAINIGKGGAGGKAAHGGNGQSSSLQVGCYSLAGAGGIGGQKVDAIGHDAHGGGSTGGDLNLFGGGGGGGSDTSPVETSGSGGSTYWGGGPTGAYAENGHPGRTFGCGGSGADDHNKIGGAGKNGVVVLHLYGVAGTDFAAAAKKAQAGAKMPPPPAMGGYGFVGSKLMKSSGTFVLPAGVNAVRLYVTGGGGGGGGHRSGKNNNGFAGGGGGGGTAIRFITGVKAGDKIQCSIGAGGAGGRARHGYNGQQTWAKINNLKMRGEPGLGGQRVDAIGHDAHGGGASGGDLNLWGGGGEGGADQSPVESSGQGGSSYWGGGPTGAYAENGHPGRTFGTGGSGADDWNKVGGSGHAGVVFVEMFGSAKVNKESYGRVGSKTITNGEGLLDLPAGVDAIKVYVTGGGGGGGGHRAGKNNNGFGGGGGAGATAIKFIKLNSKKGCAQRESASYNIGAGGTGGNNAHGSNGGTTVFSIGGIKLVATGGRGGQKVDAIGHDAHGGSASGGDLNLAGGGGGGGSDTSPVETSGLGGSTFWGGGPTGAYHENGHAAVTFGCGGSGADDHGKTGGSGKSGVVHIEYYASGKGAQAGKIKRHGYMGMVKFEKYASALQGMSSYKLPKGVTAIEAFVTGGGGGGGGHRNSCNNNGMAGGGGGGGTSIKWFSGLAPGSKLSFSIGGGGVGGNRKHGSNGGASTLTVGGAKLVGNGGVGGQKVDAIGHDAHGGSASGGDLNLRGGGGGGGSDTSAVESSGQGGLTFWGGGATGAYSENGHPGRGYGAGGSGADDCNRVGGKGADGVVVLHLYSEKPTTPTCTCNNGVAGFTALTASVCDGKYYRLSKGIDPKHKDRTGAIRPYCRSSKVTSSPWSRFNCHSTWGFVVIGGKRWWYPSCSSGKGCPGLAGNVCDGKDSFSKGKRDLGTDLCFTLIPYGGILGGGSGKFAGDGKCSLSTQPSDW